MCNKMSVIIKKIKQINIQQKSKKNCFNYNHLYLICCTKYRKNFNKKQFVTQLVFLFINKFSIKAHF